MARWPGYLPRLDSAWAQRLRVVWRAATDLRDQPVAKVLFGLSLIVYLATRLIGLEISRLFLHRRSCADGVAADFIRDPLSTTLTSFCQHISEQLILTT